MKAARPALGFGRYAPYAQGRPRHAGGESRTEDPGVGRKNSIRGQTAR